MNTKTAIAGEKVISSNHLALSARIDNAIDLINQGNFELAEKVATELCQKYPESFEANNLLAGVFFTQRKWNNALAAYAKTAELRPNYVLAYFNQGCA